MAGIGTRRIKPRCCTDRYRVTSSGALETQEAGVGAFDGDLLDWGGHGLSDMHYALSAVAELIVSHTRCDTNGISTWWTPRWASASTTAF